MNTAIDFDQFGIDGRTSTLSCAMRKGLCRTIHNQSLKNAEKLQHVNFTNRRGKNYKTIIGYMHTAWKGLVLDELEEGKGKSKKFSMYVFASSDEADDVHFELLEVPYRDPMDYHFSILNFSLSNHFLERIYQRYAGTDHRLALSQMAQLKDFFLYATGRNFQEGAYQVGLGAGMGICVLNKTDEEKPAMSAITFVNKPKLAPGQPYNVGDWRISESLLH